MGKKKARRLVLQSMERFAEHVANNPIKTEPTHPSSGGYSAAAKKANAERVVWIEEFNAREQRLNEKRIKKYRKKMKKGKRGKKV